MNHKTTDHSVVLTVMWRQAGFSGVFSTCLKGLWVFFFQAGAIRKLFAPVVALAKGGRAGEVCSVISE